MSAASEANERRLETARANLRKRGGWPSHYAIERLRRVVAPWLRTYTDRYGRRWHQLKNPHAFSTCWKDCTAMLAERSQEYVDSDLRAAIRLAITTLHEEEKGAS